MGGAGDDGDDYDGAVTEGWTGELEKPDDWDCGIVGLWDCPLNSSITPPWACIESDEPQPCSSPAGHSEDLDTKISS